MDYTELLSTTLNNYSSTIVDNVFYSNALLSKLNSKGLKKIEPGGDRIQRAVEYASNNTIEGITPYERINVTPQEIFGSAFVDWKIYAGSVTISKADIAKNQESKFRTANLFEGKVQNFEKSFKQRINQDLFLGGNSTVGRIKLINGLPEIVCNSSHTANWTTNAYSTYADIDGTVDTWWKSQYNTTTNPTLAGTSSIMNTYYKVVDAIGGDNVTPDMAITTITLYEMIENILGDKVRFDPDMAKQGFKNILIAGVPMVYDHFCTAKTFYWLCTDYLRLVVMKGWDMVFSPATQPDDQLVAVALGQWMGNLVCTNRAKQGYYLYTA